MEKKERPSIKDMAHDWHRSYGESIPYKGTSKIEAYDEIVQAIMEVGYTFEEAMENVKIIVRLTTKKRFKNHLTHIEDNTESFESAIREAYGKSIKFKTEKVTKKQSAQEKCEQELKEINQEEKIESEKEQTKVPTQEKYEQDPDDMEEEIPASEQIRPPKKRLTPEEQEEIDILLGYRR